MNDAPTKQDRVGPVVSVLAPLLSLVAVLVAAYGDLDPPVQRYVLISLAIIAASSVYAVVGRRCIAGVKRAAQAIRHRYLVWEFMGTLESFVERLDTFCDRNHCDNIPYVLRDHTQSWQRPFTDESALERLRELVGMLQHAISSLPRNKKHFSLFVGLFGWILAIYNRQFVCLPASEMLRRLPQQSEGDERLKCERLRQEYQKVKNGYVMFLEGYRDFAREINRAFGENIAPHYFERPPEP